MLRAAAGSDYHNSAIYDDCWNGVSLFGTFLTEKDRRMQFNSAQNGEWIKVGGVSRWKHERIVYNTMSPGRCHGGVTGRLAKVYCLVGALMC